MKRDSDQTSLLKMDNRPNSAKTTEQKTCYRTVPYTARWKLLKDLVIHTSTGPPSSNLSASLFDANIRRMVFRPPTAPNSKSDITDEVGWMNSHTVLQFGASSLPAVVFSCVPPPTRRSWIGAACLTVWL